jgi:phosphatidylserine/phosphatidylglycerophosphate/cardiolipin synthase-like enzyme
MPPGTSLPALKLSSVPNATSQRTRIVTTFGDPTKFAGLGPAPRGSGTLPAYPFAPTGSKSLRELVFHAIDKSERFIYVEDQYLVDEEVARRLAAAMNRLEALIIVIADSNAVNGELHQAWDRRRRFLGHLAPHAAKLAVVVGKRTVHAKLWIFDDVIALVGSANINRRGFKHDSEAGIAFGDVGEESQVKLLRESLWALQLGPAAPRLTDPPENSLATWKAPPPTANVRIYDPTGGHDIDPVDPRLSRFGFTKDEFWNLVDPDCP